MIVYTVILLKMVNKISNKKDKKDVVNKPRQLLNVNENSRTKSISLKNVPLKQVSKTSGEAEENECSNTIPNYSDNYCKQSSVVHSVTLGPRCSNEDVDLASPGLCTVLRLANEINAALADKVPPKKLSDFPKEIKHKVVKKTNVPITEHIFSNLVDLEISDEVIVSRKKTSTKSHEFIQNKDKVFNLEDYYKPYFSSEFCPKVLFKKREIEKIQHYNGFEIYDGINSLQNNVTNEL